ncbi:UNVERIFIED_CONTAM: hypothetical protein FKN15_023781 [Acipenser sinensis]
MFCFFADRPEPPKDLSITHSEVWSRGLLLRWVPGGDGSSPVRYFTVLTKELPDGEWQTHSSTISHNSTSWHIDRLKPFTSYKLRMMATNDIGDSEYSAETDTITTLQDVPDEPPVILAVTPHTTSSILVQWQRPKEESLNGVLVGYRIYYRELPYESGQPKSKTAANPSALQMDRTELNKYKRYEIVMTAYNIIGESPMSAPLEVFVGEAETRTKTTDSDYEDEQPKHSFVNHYMSDPTYYNSWKRQQKGMKQSSAYAYEECASGDTETYFQSMVTTRSSGGVYTPAGQPASGSRTPVTGFSSFV